MIRTKAFCGLKIWSERKNAIAIGADEKYVWRMKKMVIDFHPESIVRAETWALPSRKMDDGGDYSASDVTGQTLQGGVSLNFFPRWLIRRNCRKLPRCRTKYCGGFQHISSSYRAHVTSRPAPSCCKKKFMNHRTSERTTCRNESFRVFFKWNKEDEPLIRWQSNLRGSTQDFPKFHFPRIIRRA